MYKASRNQAKLSIEEAAFRVNVAPRTLSKYEAGETLPAPETVLAMSKEYRVPWMTQIYCRKECAIGQAYSYEPLTGVNLDPASIMLKLIGEKREANDILPRMLELVVNKNSRDDFTEAEWGEFVRCFQEFMDVEHNIETLKIALGQWCDVSELVEQHNQKCRLRGYVKKEKRRSADRH